MLKSILIGILLLNYYLIVNSLKSEDICIKQVECNSGNNCGFSNCAGKQLEYDCSRLECAKTAESCEEYQDMIRYMDHKKSIKLERAKTEQSIKGFSFLTKNLRKFENIKNNIKACF